MKMNLHSLYCKEQWEDMDVTLPNFDVKTICENTVERPTWLHFGAGNIFRGFIARINQSILNAGKGDTGIIAADTFDFDIIDKIYAPFDNLSMLVRLHANGNIDKEIIAGVSHAYKASPTFKDFSTLITIFENKSLQMVSFTITEKGYALKTPSGDYMDIVASDIKNGPDSPTHAMSILTTLMLKRFNSGAYPIALCSMDNCSHNGEKLRNAVLDIAKNWAKNNFVGQDFIDYISNEEIVAFPWSMIDKITPRPAKEVETILGELNIEDMSPIITNKNTFIAPFVNAEVPEYLVIEDNFPNGRPSLEVGGVYVTTREIVNKVETMKVTTCLNPLHTALAVYGPLLGYNRIYEEMKNPALRTLVEKIGYEEGMNVVIDPEIIAPRQFIDEVINERLSNPFIPDDPARIATDTSQKVGIRFGETIKAYVKSKDLDVSDLTYIPLAIAGWLRYLLAVDDNGNILNLSSDPLLNELTSTLSNLKLHGPYNHEARSILSNKNIFGIDLVQIGLAPKIEEMFVELLQGPGSVIATLDKYCNS